LAQFIRQARQDIAGAVRGLIVDHADFNDFRLLCERADRCLDRRLLVPRGEYSGNRWRICEHVRIRGVIPVTFAARDRPL
jgi:hypothetical protein